MTGQLAAALAAEQAAIYAYGLIGVRLTDAAEVRQARAAERAHRDRRDYLVARMDQLRVSPSATPGGYALPFPVVNPTGARKLAIHVEDGVAQAWRPVLAATTDTDRRAALTALTDAAVRATRWRRLAAVTPLTVAFPGRAGN